MTTNTSNNQQLAVEFLSDYLESRFKVHLGQMEGVHIPAPLFRDDGSGLAKFIQQHQPSLEEYLILVTALAPNLQPDFFNKILSRYFPNGAEVPEFGGIRGANHRGILPTGETAQFILAGEDMELRLEVQKLFSSEHWFSKKRILWLEHVREGEPLMSGRIILDPELVELLTVGTISKPTFSIHFPAELLDTEMTWDDLVLNHSTKLQIEEIENWINHHETFLREWNMNKKIKPGFRALFYGPPGTGKTLAASLLGKHTGKDVFRIDLSRVTSKFIGETEKNLANLFAKAEHKNWILFFDEADALFGKRTDIRDAHDKYANQEVSYLLQRIETYNSLVILATNQRANIDQAFIRRFQSIVHFPMPLPEERHRIWMRSMPSQIKLSKEINLEHISRQYELSGAAIMNAVQHYAIEVLANRSENLSLQQLESAIMREYVKEGKVL